MRNVFTFWEGEMPGYIKLCMDTWQIPFTVLNYNNLKDYTDLQIEPLQQYSLMLISDVVRVHVLRDHGGYWIDADTIMLTDQLPDANIVGDPSNRENSIGFLYTEPHSKMFTEWAKFQAEIISRNDAPHIWSMFGNAFTDAYVRDHTDITIFPTDNVWPETYMIRDDIHRRYKYTQLYFERQYSLSQFKQTDILMLHNSWTPKW